MVQSLSSCRLEQCPQPVSSLATTEARWPSLVPSPSLDQQPQFPLNLALYQTFHTSSQTSPLQRPGLMKKPELKTAVAKSCYPYPFTTPQMSWYSKWILCCRRRRSLQRMGIALNLWKIANAASFGWSVCPNPAAFPSYSLPNILWELQLSSLN